MTLVTAKLRRVIKSSKFHVLTGQFHEHFTNTIFRTKLSLLSTFSLLTVWLWTNFRTKNEWVKCWWNWPTHHEISELQIHRNRRPKFCNKNWKFLDSLGQNWPNVGWIRLIWLEPCNIFVTELAEKLAILNLIGIIVFKTISDKK